MRLPVPATRRVRKRFDRRQRVLSSQKIVTESIVSQTKSRRVEETTLTRRIRTSGGILANEWNERYVLSRLRGSEVVS